MIRMLCACVRVPASREKLRRLHAMLPSARLVLLLRDPVSKAPI